MELYSALLLLVTIQSTLQYSWTTALPPQPQPPTLMYVVQVAQYKMWGLSSSESVSIYWWEGEMASSATGENDEAVMRRRSQQAACP